MAAPQVGMRGRPIDVAIGVQDWVHRPRQETRDATAGTGVGDKPMIAAITGLLACQLAGEVLVRALALPLPGPVAGMGLLFCYLVLRGRGRPAAAAVPPALGRVADVLLANLSLLFIPAAVGVVQYLGLLRAYAGPLAIAISASTLAAMLVTVASFRLVSRLHSFRHKGLAGDVEAAADPERHP